MKRLILILAASLITSFSFAEKEESLVPKTPRQERQESYGSIFNNKSLRLFGGSSNDAPQQKKMRVNSHLWQASLDVLEYMPILVSDGIGGVISTDWYEDPESPNERYKINVVIKSIELKATSIQVNAFKQVLKDNVWRGAKVSDKIAQDIEEKILTRARELKLAQQQ